MPTLQGNAGIYSDDFYDGGSPSPDPVWTETDPSTVLAPSYANTGGDYWLSLVLTNNNNDYFSDPEPVGDWTAPYYAQTAGTFTNANFTIEAKIRTQAFTTAFDDCGILVRNASFIVNAGFYEDGGNLIAYFDATTGADTFKSTTIGTVGSNPAPYWIQIRRTGTTTFQGWYSLNGTSFTQIGTNTTVSNFTPNSAGVYAGCNHTTGNPTNTVHFDYFMEMLGADFVAYEDTGATGPGPSARRVMVIT